jgi:hypothetical protein
MKTERYGINPDVPPSGEGYVECLAAGGWCSSAALHRMRARRLLR